MTINCSGKILDLNEPKIMAICNITNDSFHEGSRVNSEKELIRLVTKHLENGADVIDIGGMSSRPGADEIPVEEEIAKLTWGMKTIRREFGDIIISVDTYRSAVVSACEGYGIGIVNDISGGMIDHELIHTVGKLGIPYILMHMKGRPKTMQQDTSYQNGILMSEIEYFKNRVAECEQAGIKDLIIDPGFGFGKSVEDNYVVLNHLSSFKIFEKPIMIGLSRKSMIYKILESDAADALNGTTALHMVSLLNGASLLRVHDSKEAVECVKLYKILKDNR